RRSTRKILHECTSEEVRAHRLGEPRRSGPVPSWHGKKYRRTRGAAAIPPFETIHIALLHCSRE
ncbi:hypothetical protein BDN67DRAFT_974232, partial [Paxillus ammoniavirescens]